MSRVYRFHGPAELPVRSRPVLLRKRRKQQTEQLYLLGADTLTISDRDGTRPIEAYEATCARAVTLTRRESNLIALANPGVAAPEAFEDIHPWLPECRFLNDSAASLRAAETIVRRFGKHLVSASSFCDEKWNTICNTLRQRSVHDARFYTAWHLPIQEANVLEEVRPDRSVVAIDFNGMYPSCMQQSFPHPSSLQLVRLDRNLDPDEVLATGLYRCVLEEPITNFIVRQNPLRSFNAGRHLRARLGEKVMIDLNEFELAFFRRHFRHIYLMEAVVSTKVVAHPLAREVRRSFARRINYRNQGNKALADREKFFATLMTSCASRPIRRRRKFPTYEDAMTEVRSFYGIDIPSDEPESVTDIWMDGRKGVLMRYEGDGVDVHGPALQSGSACHLLGQRIVARSRIVLLEMMERIIARAPDVEICYANIDSIHFSLPTKYLEDMVTWLEIDASEAMGSFKIEAVTQHGLWLEPGRYWLYSDTDVVKFRNRSVGDRQQPFRDHAIHVTSRRIGDLHVPIKVTLRMESTMSPSRSVEVEIGTGIARQRLVEVGDSTAFANIMDELEHNQRYALPFRIRAFVGMQERIETSRIAASKREEDANIV
jgi:hypothetical protein